MICYAREVISDEWPAMREGGASSVVDASVSAMEESAEQIPVTDAKQAAAFEHWFTLNEERRQGRGSIKPTAMERTLAQMEREHRGQAVIRCADLAG